MKEMLLPLSPLATTNRIHMFDHILILLCYILTLQISLCAVHSFILPRRAPRWSLLPVPHPSLYSDRNSWRSSPQPSLLCRRCFHRLTILSPGHLFARFCVRHLHFDIFIVLSNLYTLRSKSFTSLVTYFVVFFSLSCPVFSLRPRTRCIS